MSNDTLGNYVKPIRAVEPNAEYRALKMFNDGIEVSHRPTRKREEYGCD